jgi:monoamine oxidase
MKKILTDPNVQLLIKQFDLEVPKMHNILVDSYELNDGKIVILSAKVLDNELNFVKFADQSRLIDHLHMCNVIFDDRIKSPEVSNR